MKKGVDISRGSTYLMVNKHSQESFYPGKHYMKKGVDISRGSTYLLVNKHSQESFYPGKKDWVVQTNCLIH